MTCIICGASHSQPGRKVCGKSICLARLMKKKRLDKARGEVAEGERAERENRTRQMILAAVTAERERCAWIAENHKCTTSLHQKAPGACGCRQNTSIAAEIRKS